MSIQFLLEDLSSPELLGVNLSKSPCYQTSLLQILLTEGPPSDDLDESGEVYGGRQVELLHDLQPSAQSPELLMIQHQLVTMVCHLPLSSQMVIMIMIIIVIITWMYITHLSLVCRFRLSSSLALAHRLRIERMCWWFLIITGRQYYFKGNSKS